MRPALTFFQNPEDNIAVFPLIRTRKLQKNELAVQYKQKKGEKFGYKEKK